MINVSASQEELQELAQYLGAFPKEIQSIIDESKGKLKDHLHDLLVEGTPQDSGKTRKAWSSVETEYGLSFFNTEVSAYVLEEGKFSGVGPKTVQTSSGIFSKQAPEGIIQPIMNDDKQLGKIADLLLEEMLKNVRMRREL